MIVIHRSASIAARVLLTLIFSSLTIYAAGEVDTTFAAKITLSGSSAFRVAVPQPDGKVLVGGTFRSLGAYARAGIARLNTDGTIDVTFLAPDIFDSQFLTGGEVRAISVQSDGKILVGGIFRGAGPTLINSILRLNADGSIDPSFSSPFGVSTTVNKILVLPDGDIVVGGAFILNAPGGNRNHLARLDPDGSLDPTVYANTASIATAALQPDGKIITASTTANALRRLDANGSLDPTFNASTVTSITDLHLLADGKFLLTGSFTLFDGAVVRGVARAFSNGRNDPSFNPGGFGAASGIVHGIEPYPLGRFLIHGSFQTYNGVPKFAVVINADGVVDPAFNNTTEGLFSIGAAAVLPDGKVVAGGFAPSLNRVFVLEASGANDVSRELPLSYLANGMTLAVYPDDRILVGGQFSHANLFIQRNTLVRFDPDGNPDTFAQTFLSPTLGISGLDIEPSSTVLVAPPFNAVRRLSSNGAFVRDFNAESSNSHDVKSLSDGRLLIASSIALERFLPSGTIDSTFADVIAANINEIAVQADGKVIIVGGFVTVNGVTRNRVARINTNGTLDESFVPSTNGNVDSVAIQPDGKVIIGGGFTSVNGDNTKQYLARLNPNGTLDPSLSTGLNGPVLALKLQSDGKIIIGGAMSAINGVGRRGIGRVNADGTSDAAFNVGIGTNGAVSAIRQQSDGNIIYSGEFTSTNGISTLGIGRLLNPAVPPGTQFDYDGDQKADVSVFRSSENRWYVLRSSDSAIYQPFFGAAGDIPVPADYDGDQKTDVAIYRPSNGQWWYLSSIDGSQVLNPFGSAGDIPRPSDFDGDGKADLIIFRPSNNTWYRYGSATNQETTPLVFGVAGDQPVIGDFDGDGKSDPAIFRPSNGDWWYAASSAGGAFRNVHWGQNGDLPVPADYDGDSKTDYAVFRPSDGGWYIYNSSNGSFTTTAFGTNGDRPVAADYDGDGRADLAVFRPSSGLWYLLRSTSGFTGLNFGISTDTPTQSSFVP